MGELARQDPNAEQMRTPVGTGQSTCNTLMRLLDRVVFLEELPAEDMKAVVTAVTALRRDLQTSGKGFAWLIQFELRVLAGHDTKTIAAQFGYPPDLVDVMLESGRRAVLKRFQLPPE